MALYVYDITTQTANGNVAVSKLTTEIQQSTITIALDYVQVDGSTLNIVFKADLSTDEKTTLDSIVSAHDGIEEPVVVEKKTSDGRLITLTSNYDEGYILYIAGKDSNGNLFSVTPDAPIVEAQFSDDLVLVGGYVYWENGAQDDSIDFYIYAPGTSVVANGTTTGNCNLAGDPAVLIVPANGDGAYDVDLTQAVPVPAPNGDGYWDLDIDGNPVANSAGTGKYNLYTIDITLSHHIEAFPLMGQGMVKIGEPNIKPEKVLRQWKFKTVLDSPGSTTGLHVRWALICGRKS